LKKEYWQSIFLTTAMPLHLRGKVANAYPLQSEQV